MHIAIFGASRGVGRACVDTALAHGHGVTALARTGGTLAATGATVVLGDVLDPATVARAVAGSDGVIVALGVTPRQRATTPEDICSRGTQTILAALTAATDRIVVVTSYGVGTTRSRTPFVFSIIAKTLLKNIMADKERQERMVRESRTRWTIVQPLGLTDGPATGAPYTSTDGSRKTTRVARADVAAVCVAALETGAFIGECVAVCAV